MRARMLAAAALLIAALPAPAQNASADLAMVPSDAALFIHVRASDIWHHDIFKGIRDTVAAAGPKALAAFEAQVYPNPADLDRVTLVLRVNKQKPNGPPDVTVIVAFKNDVDGAKIRQLYFPHAKETALGAKKMFVDENNQVALHFPDGKHLLAGQPHALDSFVAAVKGDGPLSAAVAQASGKAITIAANVKAIPIPPHAYDDVPPDIRPLTMVERVLLTVDLGKPGSDAKLELKASYASEQASTDAEKALKAAIAMGKQALMQGKSELEKKLYENADKGPQSLEKSGEAAMALFGLGAMNQLEKMADTLPITRSGSDLVAAVTVPKEFTSMNGMATSGVLLGLLLPATQKVREAAGRTASSNNLKQIGLAMHNHASTYERFPAAAICDKEGKPLLSWRVAILPFIEEEGLYRQFKLDEPWDSPNNKPLIEKMPKIYASPTVPTKAGETIYKAFVGKEALMDWKESAKFSQVTDGLSNTIVVAEGGDPVTWTKPDDFAFDASKDPPKLNPDGRKVIQVLFADGSVRSLNLETLPKASLKGLITRAGGEVPDFDGDAPRAVPARPGAIAPVPPQASRAVPPPPPPPSR